MTAPLGFVHPPLLRERLAWVGVASVVPLAATLGALRWLVPSPMDGGLRGPLAALAWLGDQHPLALGVALFLVFSAVARHWWSQAIAPRASTHDRLRGARFWVALAIVLIAASLLRRTIGEVTRVASASMVPTLDVRDRVLVNRLAYGVELPLVQRRIGAKPPRRGDVVVFSGDARPADDARTPGEPRTLVKRVLGLPGDVLSFDHGGASINGWHIPVCDAGPFVSSAGTTTIRGRLVVEFLEDAAYLTVREPADDTMSAPFRVPPGEVFVVGDARTVSRDSRAWNHGRGAGIATGAIEGRVTRFAATSTREGRLDLASIFAPLGLTVREPDVDLRKTAADIAACLQRRPAQTQPPAALQPGAH
jgi:signal peptidase I